MDDGRPIRDAARIYKNGALKAGRELEIELNRIIKLSFSKLLEECTPLTQQKLDYLMELVSNTKVDLNKSLKEQED